MRRYVPDEMISLRLNHRVLQVPGGEWQEATVALGPIVITWGKFLADLVSFAIVAFVVFIIAKKLLKEDKVAKK